jgi:hypothetical protein
LTFVKRQIGERGKEKRPIDRPQDSGRDISLYWLLLRWWGMV